MTVKDKKRKPKKPAKKDDDDMVIVWKQDIPIPVIEEPEDWYTQW